MKHPAFKLGGALPLVAALALAQPKVQRYGSIIGLKPDKFYLFSYFEYTAGGWGGMTTASWPRSSAGAEAHRRSNGGERYWPSPPGWPRKSPTSSSTWPSGAAKRRAS